MAVFKRLQCADCKKFRQNVPSIRKEPGACPKCAGALKYSDNWYISYTVLGKKYVEAVTPKKRDAEVRLGKIKTNLKEGRFFDKAPSTPWHKAAKDFEAWYKVNVKPHTQRMYELGLKNLKPYFERLTLDKISPHMVEQFKAKRSTEVSNSSVNRDLATLKRLMSLCETWGFVEVNRVRKVGLLKENKSRIRFLEAEEITALLEAARSNQKLYVAITIALNTGLRKEGVMTLKWAEVDFKENMIHKAVKGDTVVHVPLTASLRDVLIEHKKASKVLSPYILPSRRVPGAPIRDVRAAFAKALTMAKIKDFRFHDLRHTFATHFLRQTKDLKALQEILGHANIKMTMRYSHVLKEHLTEAMKHFSCGSGTH